MEPLLIFLDIDGTIASYETPPSPLTRQAVAEAGRAGHRVFLCTGRGYCDIPPHILDLEIAGVVGAAGAHIVIDGEVVYETVLPTPLVRETAALFMELRYSAFLEGRTRVYAIPGRYVIPKRDYPVIDSLETFDRLAGELQVCKYAYLSSQPHGSRFLDYVEAHYDHVPHMTNFGEILPKGVNKAVAIRRVAEHFGMPVHRTLGVGDSLNDLQMLECVGTAVAMGNAPEVVRGAADHVTGTLEEDGVYHALRHLGIV